MGKKMIELRGFVNGLNFASRIIDVAQIELLRKIKTEKAYKVYGFQTWADFCRDGLGYSEDYIDERIKTIQKLGSELTKILLNARLSWSDIRLIPRMLDEAQREKLNKQNVIEVDDRKIEVSEDNADAVVSTVKMLLERQKRMEKETEKLQRKMKQLEQEEKKMEKSYQERIKELEMKLPENRADTTWSVEYLKEVHDLYTRFAVALRQFVFDPRLKDPANIELLAKATQYISGMSRMILDLERRWNEFYLEDEEDDAVY